MENSLRQLFINFLEPIAYFIYVITLLIILYRQKDRPKRVLLVFYMAATAIIFFACIKAYLKNIGDNNWLYNTFFLLLITTLSWYFHQLFTSPFKKKFVKAAYLANLTLFLIFVVISGRFFLRYNNFVVAFCYLTIVIYTIFYFHQLINNVTEQNLLLDFNFWLATGYLIYFLGAFFIVLFYEGPSRYRGLLWGLQNVIVLMSALVTLSGTLYLVNKNRSS